FAAPPEFFLDWLDGLDVVYSAETFYDWRLVEWARDRGVATVLHVMPELLGAISPAQMPPRLWRPTGWRMSELPAGTEVVPVPVAADRFCDFRPSSEADGPLRVLHVAGRRAAADRNGTLSLYQALRTVGERVEITITTQDDRLPLVTGRPANVHLRSV